MPSKYPIFDRNRLLLRPLAERDHDMRLDYVLGLDQPAPDFDHADLPVVADRMVEARKRGAARMLIMGAHLIKQGASRHIIDLVRRGWIDQIAFNGAGAIHDYELARMGATTESVARYIRTGDLGLCPETGEVNDSATEAAANDLGLGENVGRRILADNLPHADVSILAAAYEVGVPVTVHGHRYDIIHEHPNCDGGALGKPATATF